MLLRREPTYVTSERRRERARSDFGPRWNL